MALVLVACPYCANMQHVDAGLGAPFCASCGKPFQAMPLSKMSNADLINAQGYDLIRTDNAIAEDLFRCALRLAPDSFAALMGVALAHQIRLETSAHTDKSTLAIGFYLLRKRKGGWRLLEEDAAAADRYAEFLDAAIARAPDDETREKLKVYKKHNIEDAFRQTQTRIAPEASAPD